MTAYEQGLWVTWVHHVGAHRLGLTFNEGSHGEVDLAPHLIGPVFEPLKDERAFAEVLLDEGVVSWPGGADFAPEFLLSILDPMTPIEVPPLEAPEAAPPKVLTFEESLAAYPLHDRAREMLKDPPSSEDGSFFFHTSIFLQAFLAQSSVRIPNEGDPLPPDRSPAGIRGTQVRLRDPWLLRFVIRRHDTGPIYVLCGNVVVLVDVIARSACLERYSLLVPGMPLAVYPHDAILLGSRVSAREAFDHYLKALPPCSAPVSTR